jgi:long-chain acyl-CoA synthetase
MMRVSTIPDLLLNLKENYRKPSAFKFKEDGRWIDVSTDEFVSRVEQLFFGLGALGLRCGDRAAILSENRLEWAVADYASCWRGAITVPIYTTLSALQIKAILQDSGASILFVSTAELLEKVKAVRFQLPALRYIVVFDHDLYQPGAIRLDTLYDIGRQTISNYPEEFRQCARAVSPEDVATIVYTSGTTGVPKGAMLTHRNVVSNIIATTERLPIHASDTTLSFLPLSHVFQRHVDYACVYAGATIAYAENLNTVVANMAEVRPTFAGGVPRFFEKVYGRILAQIDKDGLRKAIFNDAMRAGRKFIRTGEESLHHKMAERLVYRKLREKFGGRLRWFISGGAPLQKDIAEFFFAVGLPIYEGYGLTETAPVITLNGPGAYRIGSVGQPVGDVEVRVAADGEILVRGSNVMKGYFGMRRESELALQDGWLKTGDIGEVDDDGFLKITDRKKDLIVTSSGKNVAPQPIESRLKSIPYFENLVVIGDGRNYISALIVPNLQALSAYAQQNKIAFKNPAELVRHREIHELAMREIDRKTQDLAAFEKVRKIAFLENEFTIDGGEMTPTMKVRRAVIEKKYKADIDQLYAA